MLRLKKIIRLVVTIAALLASVKHSSAQQDPLYTQYMDNLLIVNPGYAGSKADGVALLVARNQWVAFKGAPETRSFSYNAPTKSGKIGLGFSLLSDKIGPLKQTGVYFDYSYFLRLSDKYRIGLGLKAGVSFYRANLTDLITITPDPIFDRDIFKNFLPNVGVGFYMFSDDTYFGLSVPRIIENEITRESVNTQYIDKQKIHVYSVAGHKFNPSENFQLKTYGMMKWVKHAPISFDITALAGFKERFWVGGMYRFGAAYGFIAQFKPFDKLVVGYSYDITINELGGYQSGSHEIMLAYNFNLFK